MDTIAKDRPIFLDKIKRIYHLKDDMFYIVTEWFDEQDSEALSLDSLCDKYALDINDVLEKLVSQSNNNIKEQLQKIKHMELFENVNVYGYEGKWTFECFPNTETININDAYLFLFEDEICVSICSSTNEMNNINSVKAYFNTGFWKQCFKIKNTNFDLENLK